MAGYLASADARVLTGSAMTEFAYKDSIASLQFFQLPRWGNLAATQRLACEKMLYAPAIRAQADKLVLDVAFDYGHCLEPEWFDLFRVKQLKGRFFAFYQCEGEDFADLNGVTLGELAERWQNRARCQSAGAVRAAWSYEIDRDDHANDFALAPSEDDIRRRSRWRMTLMAEDGTPCQGRWQDGDFAWNDCRFGARQQTLAAWRNGKPWEANEDIVFGGTYKETHSLGTGYYLTGYLDVTVAQWAGKVTFSVDHAAPRLTPETPTYDLTFRNERISGSVYSDDD